MFSSFHTQCSDCLQCANSSLPLSKLLSVNVLCVLKILSVSEVCDLGHSYYLNTWPFSIQYTVLTNFHFILININQENETDALLMLLKKTATIQHWRADMIIQEARHVKLMYKPVIFVRCLCRNMGKGHMTIYFHRLLRARPLVSSRLDKNLGLFL